MKHNLFKAALSLSLIASTSAFAAGSPNFDRLINQQNQDGDIIIAPAQNDNIDCAVDNAQFPDFAVLPGQAMVCIDRNDVCGQTWSESLYVDPDNNHLNDHGPARWAEISWDRDIFKLANAGLRIATGRTTKDGFYRSANNREDLLCGSFPLNTVIQTKVRLRSPGPEGNSLYTKWNQVEFSTFNKKGNFVKINGEDRTEFAIYNQNNVLGNQNIFAIIPAPIIQEKVIADEFEGQLLPKDSLPMLITNNGEEDYRETSERVNFDYNTNRLYYDGFYTGNSEAGQYRVSGEGNEKGGFITGDDFPNAPEYNEKGSSRALVFDYVDSQYDYESGLLGAPNGSDIQGLFGTGETPSSYSNFKIYLANSASLEEMFESGSDVCSAQSVGDTAELIIGQLNVPENRQQVVNDLNINLVQASQVELKFLQTILNGGGIAGGNLPSVFMSSNGRGNIYGLAEFFNTQRGKLMSSAGSGKTYYENLPVLDLNTIDDSKGISILIVESDSRFGNDIVHCEHNIDLEDRIANDDLIFNNGDFLDSINWSNVYGQFRDFKGYTFEMKLKVVDSISVR